MRWRRCPVSSEARETPETVCTCGHMRWEHNVEMGPRHCQHEYCRCLKFEPKERAS